MISIIGTSKDRPAFFGDRWGEHGHGLDLLGMCRSKIPSSLTKLPSTVNALYPKPMPFGGMGKPVNQKRILRPLPRHHDCGRGRPGPERGRPRKPLSRPGCSSLRPRRLPLDELYSRDDRKKWLPYHHQRHVTRALADLDAVTTARGFPATGPRRSSQRRTAPPRFIPLLLHMETTN